MFINGYYVSSAKLYIIFVQEVKLSESVDDEGFTFGQITWIAKKKESVS